MIKKEIKIEKIARYFVLGAPGPEIRQVWLICHGYGQLANYFLKQFEVLNNGQHLLIAPEGLHRFYVKGFSERVGASWMTKEDRLNDIRDYVNYLDQVYVEILEMVKKENIRINVLGFSQGTATVCRWLSQGKVKAHNVILWGGGFPPDLDFETHQHIFNSLNTYLVIGDKDEFIDQQQVEEQEEILKEKGINYSLRLFNGKHEINAEALLDLAKKL